jgi:hypothetical protein
MACLEATVKIRERHIAELRLEKGALRQQLEELRRKKEVVEFTF